MEKSEAEAVVEQPDKAMACSVFVVVEKASGRPVCSILSPQLLTYCNRADAQAVVDVASALWKDGHAPEVRRAFLVLAEDDASYALAVPDEAPQ